MKNSFLIILIGLLAISGFAQQKFVPDAYGHVDDVAFSKLIADRHYSLVGSFVTVSQHPDVQYAKVCQYGKWGFIDAYGNEVIKPQYFFINDYKGGFAIAVYEEYITSGRGYDDVGSSQRVMRYVFINLKGAKLTQPYDHAEAFYNGFAEISRGGRKGIIDDLGLEIIPPEYNYIYVQDKYIIAGTQGGKWGAFTLKGKPLVPFVYDNIRWFNGFLLGYTGKGYCLLNPDTGKPLSNNLYTNTNIHDQNTDYNNRPFIPDVLVVCNDKGCFLINKKGRRISDIYEKGVRQSSDHYYLVQHKSGMGLINDKGKEVIACNYDYAGPYEDGTMFFAKKGEVISYINPKGKMLDVSAYDGVGNFSNGRAYVHLNGKGFGFIDYEGRLVIPAVYDHPSTGFEYDKDKAAIRKEGKWGIISRSGEVIVPFIYDELYRGYKCYYTGINHKRGLLDDNGQELIAPQYQSLEYIPLGDGLLQAQLEGKWGIIDLKNNIMVPLAYDRIDRDYMDQGLVTVQKDGLSGIVNLKGIVLVPVIYENPDGFNNFGAGLISVDKEYHKYLADLYGHEYLRLEIDEWY